MALIVSAGDSKTYTPAPAGVHQAVCVDVIDKGILEVTYAGKTKKQHKISLAWQIEELRDDLKRYVVYKRYTASLNEKATLRKDLESWRGRAFTREEEMAFDVESVIGANGLINIQHNTKDGQTYANVVSIMPLAKGMVKLASTDYVREKDRAETPSADTSQALTEDDIPFMWLVPFVLPALFAAHVIFA